MVENEDFSECAFIEQAMKFYTYDDFCKNRHAIKRLFKCLSKNGCIFYKYYVYANTHMTIIYKNKVWDYLNDFISDAELVHLLAMYKPI